MRVPQLREELQQASIELESTKERLTGAQHAVTATLAEARELKRQMKLLQPRLQCLQREHELLTDAVRWLSRVSFICARPGADKACPRPDCRLTRLPIASCDLQLNQPN